MISAGESFYCVKRGRTLFSQTFSPSLPTLHGRREGEGGGGKVNRYIQTFALILV